MQACGLIRGLTWLPRARQVTSCPWNLYMRGEKDATSTAALWPTCDRRFHGTVLFQGQDDCRMNIMCCRTPGDESMDCKRQDYA